MNWAPHIKLFKINTKVRLTKRREVTRKVGFVFVFPWHKPDTRAQEKYPGLKHYELTEVKRK